MMVVQSVATLAVCSSQTPKKKPNTHDEKLLSVYIGIFYLLTPYFFTNYAPRKYRFSDSYAAQPITYW
jgi:hypothetical protein